MKFIDLVNKLLEDLNVYPQAKNVYGRPAPSPGPNINFRGSVPQGFKGANVPGIAPDDGQAVLIRLPKKNKKKK